MRSPLLENTIVLGTQEVLGAAVASGVRRVVYVSSSGAINGSKTPRVFDEQSLFELSTSGLRYAIAKHRAEEICKTFHARLEVVIVNPVETYGPNDVDLITARNLLDILKGWPAIGCHGGTAVAYVDDVADGIVKALFRGRSGERYILGGENITIEQLIRITLKIAGQQKPVVILPNKLIRGVIASLSKMRLPTPLLPEVLDYATLYWFMDTSKACRELDYSPRPAHETLEPTIRWLYDTGQAR
jgi:dihydroflavonol-4-reductase